MQHQRVLNTEELDAVHKFQEYGATIMVGYGNKATWSDLVHSDSYTTDGINTKLAELRSKANKQQEAFDDGDMDAPPAEFYVYDRSKTRINFSTGEAVLVLRAAKKCRKYFEDAAEIAKLEAELGKLDLKSMSKEDRLGMQRTEIATKLAKLKGQPAPIAQPEPSPMAESVAETK